MFRYYNLFAFLSLFLVVVSIGSLAAFQVRVGIDFSGGSILEVAFIDTRPSLGEIQSQLAPIPDLSSSTQPIGEKGVIIRMKDISEETHQQILQALGEGVEEVRFESIGPVIGRELRSKTILFILLSLLIILVYIALAFRRTVEYVKPWQWSLGILATLIHDLLIPIGALSLLGRFQGVEVNIPIVVALLTVMGYSINDTIVVFDRIRENLTRHQGIGLFDTIKASVRQTFARSFNTSFTTLLVLFALLFWGGESLRFFALTLIIGIIAGTYSSLFFAPWTLLRWEKLKTA